MNDSAGPVPHPGAGSYPRPCAPRFSAIAGVTGFFSSLGGRLAIILALGMAASAMVAMFVSNRVRDYHVHEYQVNQSLLSAADIAQRLERAPKRTQAALDAGYVLGAGAASSRWTMTAANPRYSRLLRERLGPGSQAQVMLIAGHTCFGRFDQQVRAAGMRYVQMPDCWFVRFRDSHGQARTFTVVQPPGHADKQPVVGFPYLELIIVASVLLGLLGARLATAPLRRMTRAAKAFSLIEDAEPIPEKGPSEVRTALRTFNLMQARVREGLRERTQILASVTHDLQTPLTRLRLRLEQVEDEALRERLIADLAATRELVRDGLDLARSSEAREPWSTLDLDSFLSSLSEDAAEFGHDVVYEPGPAMHARVKPNALQRCVDNLVENAVKYAGSARIECCSEATEIVIRVLDRGPGLPEDQIDKAFDAFWRLGGASSLATNGTGIGLTIAQAQASTFGASVSLANRDGGGLAATVRIPAALVRST